MDALLLGLNKLFLAVHGQSVQRDIDKTPYLGARGFDRESELQLTGGLARSLNALA